MSAGIYMYNGILAYSLNLEKKLRRRKGAIIIEKGENITKDVLQKMLDKHIKITKVKEITKPLKYRWYNPKTREIIITVKNNKLESPWIEFTIKKNKITFKNPVSLNDKFLGQNIMKINDYEYDYI